MYALVDCNSFYASCEQVFRPRLQGKPVIVLSNNDGCVVARSPEAKALGIAMAQPFFQIKGLCHQHRVAVFSSNYELYGDMSARVMNILKRFAPHMETYSIDEAFLEVSDVPVADLQKYACEIRQTVRQWTGIPVSIGIAPTKTLAKIANATAKKQAGEGVTILYHQKDINESLQHTPVVEVWGIGNRKSAKLHQMGIRTAWDLSHADTRCIRQQFSVVTQRTQWELQGVSCMGLEEIQPRKNILSSRSFSRPVTALAELEEAVAVYATRAGEKLRAQQSLAQGMGVFIYSNRFRPEERQYRGEKFFALSTATCSTNELIYYGKAALRQLYRSGINYKKAGIMLLDLIPASQRQHSLWDTPTMERQETLMTVMDAVNRKHGKNTLFFAALGINRDWQMKQELRSPRYTTRWEELISC